MSLMHLIKRVAKYLLAYAYVAWFTLPLIAVIALIIAIPLGALVYVATYGSDEPLKAACAQDTVFSRFSLLTGKREFWQAHMASLDGQIREKESLPAKIEAEAAAHEAMRQSVRQSVIENLEDARKKAAEKKTPSQRAADALRRQADDLRRQADEAEAVEVRSAFQAKLREEIKALQICKTHAAEQLSKAR